MTGATWLPLSKRPNPPRHKGVRTRHASWTMNEEDVRARMAQQWPASKRIGLAEVHLVNDEQVALMLQILALHRRMMSLCYLQVF